MKILVVGSGGREDCICWKVNRSPLTKKLFCAPGNPGTSRWATNVSISVDAVSELVAFSKTEQIDLCIVGPEVPLSLGLVDSLQSEGIKVFGPTKAAAELEASKAFAKEVMVAAGVPTAGYKKLAFEELEDYLRSEQTPFVLKADGLAAGKGVVVCLKPEDVKPAIAHLRDSVAATSVIVEEFIEGIEVSCIYACHGDLAVALSSAHDYKRIFDGDQGPNTGGMGTVSPSPRISQQMHASVIERVITPVLLEMSKRGKPFTGFLYAGLMLDASGYKVLEFNTRLGDPETQVLLPRLKTDLVEAILELLKDEMPRLEFDPAAHVCLVLASGGYPESSTNGAVIEGIEFAEQRGGKVFHAGTALNAKRQVVTNGGRVLNVVGSGATVEEARTVAYRAADMVQFSGRQMRRDIGLA